MQRSRATLCLSLLLAAGSQAQAAGAASADADWARVRALMQEKGILRLDLPPQLVKAHDLASVPRLAPTPNDRAQAIAAVENFVANLVVDASFLLAKQERLRGQVRNVLATRPDADAERDQVNTLVDRALALVAQENWAAANAAFNAVAAWVESYRDKPVAPMPAACRDPEPPPECRPWLLPKQPSNADVPQSVDK